VESVNRFVAPVEKHADDDVLVRASRRLTCDATIVELYNVLAILQQLIGFNQSKMVISGSSTRASSKIIDNARASQILHCSRQIQANA
jgi:hypothetical protein